MNGELRDAQIEIEDLNIALADTRYRCRRLSEERDRLLRRDEEREKSLKDLNKTLNFINYQRHGALLDTMGFTEPEHKYSEFVVWYNQTTDEIFITKYITDQFLKIHTDVALIGFG